MSGLHENLTTAFAAVEPGAAPVEAAMLTGRKIRNRRRAGLSRSGEIAVAIPFNAPDGFPTFSAWLRPGQARPPQFSGAFGSGVTATAYVGPWGTCLEVDNTGDCSPVIDTPGTAMMGASGSAVFGSAAESVSYVTITRKDGSTLRAAAIAVGPQKFWAVPMSQAEQTGARWTAYDAAGKAVGSGAIEPG